MFAVLLVLQLATFTTAFGVKTEGLTDLSYQAGILADFAFAAILLARYRSMNPIDQQRTRWVLLGSLGLLAYLFADAVESTYIFPGLQEWIAWDPGKLEAVLALPFTLAILLPLAVSVAIQRSRLFPVRVLLTRPTTYVVSVAVLLVAALIGEELFKKYLDEFLAEHVFTGAGGIASLIILVGLSIGDERARRAMSPRRRSTRSRISLTPAKAMTKSTG